jgi:hypothetical protein
LYPNPCVRQKDELAMWKPRVTDYTLWNDANP